MKFTEEEKAYIVKFVSKGSSARPEERLDFLKIPISVAAKNWGKTSARKLVKIGRRICSDQLLRGSTPCSVLYRAIETGDAAFVDLILGVDKRLVHLQDAKGETPLHFAGRQGNAPVIRKLVEHGSDIVAHSRVGDIPFSLAVQGGHSQAVETLLELAARRDPSVSYFELKSPRALMASAVGHHPDILRALIQHCMMNHHTIPVRELMPDVVTSGKADAVEALLDAGADIEGRYSEDGSGPLHLAAKDAVCDVMNTLLQRGANVDAKDHMGRTPLHRVALGIAEVAKAVKAVEILVTGGADGTAKDADGMTPLNLADQNLKAAMEPMLAQARAKHSWQQKIAVVQWKKQLGRKVANEGLYSLLMRLAGLEEEGLFRRVLGFL